jgi:hypothetical protein
MSESHSTCMKLVGEKTTKDKVQNHFELTSDDIPAKTKAEPKAKKRAGGARQVKIKECFKTIVMELILLL